jgi:predicted phosphodiesterase
MIVGLIADVHGNDRALEAVLRDAGDVSWWLFAGDLTGYYPFVEECWALLAGCRLDGVRGNHDEILTRWLDLGEPPAPDYRQRYGSALRRARDVLSSSALAALRSWPVRRVEAVGDTLVHMVHGAPWDPLEGRVYPDFVQWDRFDGIEADVVLLGHTHYPLVHEVDGRLIVNPGSVGQARDRSGTAAYALLDTSSKQVELRRVPYDPTKLLEDAERHDPDLPYLREVLLR